jgi:hypothetical protein
MLSKIADKMDLTSIHIMVTTDESLQQYVA